MTGRSTQASKLPLTKRVALVALMTALCVVGRELFAAIPNVQPMSAVIILLTVIEGPSLGLPVAVLSLLISNLLMGFGVWTIAQLIAYTVVVLLVALLPMRHLPFWLQAGAAGLMGLVYGFVVSFAQLPLLGGVGQTLSYWLAGLTFDLLHAASNLGFYALLHPVLRPLLARYHR